MFTLSADEGGTRYEVPPSILMYSPLFLLVPEEKQVPSNLHSAPAVGKTNVAGGGASMVSELRGSFLPCRGTDLATLKIQHRINGLFSNISGFFYGFFSRLLNMFRPSLTE